MSDYKEIPKELRGIIKRNPSDISKRLGEKALNSLSEKDIEDFFWEHPERISIAGQHINHWIDRQMRLPSGILDLLGVLNNGHIVVVELKKGEITSEAIAQVCRYRGDVYRAINMNVHKFIDRDDVPTIFACCIGSGLSEKVLFESNAMGVYSQTYSLNVFVSPSPVHWSNEKLEAINNQLIQVANSEKIQEYIHTANRGAKDEKEYQGNKLKEALHRAKWAMEINDGDTLHQYDEKLEDGQ